MKQICIVLFVCIGSYAKAQLPTNVNTQKPAPEKLKLVQPADIVITDMTLVSANFDHGVKGWVIKVNVTAKNNGQLIAASTDLKPLIQIRTTAWQDIGTAGTLPALKPGESVTKEYVFVDKKRLAGQTATFKFKIWADANNRVKESNDSNNESALLTISSN